METDDTASENGPAADSAYESGSEKGIVHEDNAAFGHLRGLRDAVTQGEVTSGTTLIPLYQYNGDGCDNPLLKNLTGIVAPKVRCGIESIDLAAPCSTVLAETRHCKLTCNKLLLAPTVRLEYEILDDASSQSLVTLALEWHFNNYDGNEAKIREFAVYDGGNMVRFKAGRPTSSGFGQLPRFMSRLSGEQVQAVGVLDQLRCSERTRSFTFRLDQSALTMKDKLELNNIYDRLPGGNPKMLLPSIGRREYTAFPGGQHNLPIYGSHEHEIDAMIKASPPFPMVPLPAADEFATLREAAAELSMASTITERERNEALRLWANPESPHQATLYALDELPLIGIKFGGYNLLQGTDKFTLPEHLYADITIVLPGTVGVEFAAFHYPSALGLPKHDAYFVITSVDGSRFRQLCRNVKAELTDLKAGNSAPKHSKATERQSFAVKIKPHYNSFTCHGQLKTLQLLCQNGTNQRWHRILLNQQHYAIVEVDMTKDAEVSEKEEEEAYQQLVNFMPWNAEQMEVIEGIRTAPDGMQIVLGPAGTGKTSLQEALAIYFWRLGYHVLALAPANSNADHLTRLMLKEAVKGLRCHRLYPSSRDLGLDKMEKGQAEHRRVGHQNGNATGSHEFFFLLARLEEHKNEKTTARDCGVEQAVIDEALKGELSLMRRLETRDPVQDDDRGKVDIWKVVRDGIDESEEIKKHNEEARCFNADRKPGDGDRMRLKEMPETRKARLAEAYRLCKGHIISETRFMITTTGNARSAELLAYFGKDKDGGANCKGMIVFVDEACKDHEVNLWAPIVCEAWAAKVKGVVLFGDEKQLNPANTNAKTATGEPQFNPYSDRLSLSLPTRLVRQGFRYVALKTQMRMHQDLVDFVNRSFYRGALADGSGTDVALEQCEPGLQRVLTRIIADQITDPAAAEKYLEDESEAKARQHWVQLSEEDIGDVSSYGRSVCYKAFADVFFDSIFPGLHEHFGDRLEANVMVICGYSHAKRYWNEKASEVANRVGLATTGLPKIITIAPSQGQESFMTIIDGSIKYRHRLGFMIEKDRCNVALSRAKGIRWVIGGPIAYNPFRIQREADVSPFPQLYDELQQKGMVHRFTKGTKARAHYSA